MTISKKGFCVLLASIILLSAFPFQAMAFDSNAETDAKQSVPMVRWTNISDISLALTISSSGKASCTGTIIGHPGTTNIDATFFLQRRTGNNPFGTFYTFPTANSSNSYLKFSDSYTVSSGYDYRMGCTVTVTRNGVSETITVYSLEKSY